MHARSFILPRYFERELGVEFTPFEARRKKEIIEAKKRRAAEVTGYVKWLSPPGTLLLLPTMTTGEPNVLCHMPFGTARPPDRSFVTAKGSWTYFIRDGNFGAPLLIFNIESYSTSKPDIAEIKPDITYKEFRGTLFDGLYDVDEAVQDFLAHSLVSSPTSLGRLGGLSVSLYNEYEGKRKSALLQGYIAAHIPQEVLSSSGYSLVVPGIPQKAELDPFHWMLKSFSADEALSQEELGVLDRPVTPSLPLLSKEITVSMFSRKNRPTSIRDPPAAKVDVPIVVGKDVETRQGVYDPSPAVFKFIIATHMAQVELPANIYQESLDYLRKEILTFTSEYDVLRSELGKGRILDLNMTGKPLSLLHLALSNGRSTTKAQVDLDTVKRAFALFKDNADNTMRVWEDIHLESGKYNLSVLAPEERKIIGFIVRNGPSSPELVFDSLKSAMSESTFGRMWKSLYNGGAIYEKNNGLFDIVPNLTEL